MQREFQSGKSFKRRQFLHHLGYFQLLVVVVVHNSLNSIKSSHKWWCRISFRSNFRFSLSLCASPPEWDSNEFSAKFWHFWSCNMLGFTSLRFSKEKRFVWNSIPIFLFSLWNRHTSTTTTMKRIPPESCPEGRPVRKTQTWKMSNLKLSQQWLGKMVQVW